jgi:glycosyltransferase involved in cell wall biosynthesis
MRIAILCDYPVFLLPGISGTAPNQAHFATWLPQLSEALSAHPEAGGIHWITLNENIDSPQQLTHQGQTFHILPKSASGRATSLYRSDLKHINRILNETHPDIVHGWGTEDVYALAAYRCPYPHIISMQGILSYYVRKNRFPLRFYLQALIEFFILKRSPVITVESKWGKSILEKINPRANIHCIEYGVNPLWYDIPWNPDPSRPAAIFIGGLSPRKGCIDLVEAFSSDELADKELWVVGSGTPDYTSELRAKSAHNIKWLGRLSPEETARHLSRAWCLALPTRADTSPNVVKEARTVGLPVITTPHGGQSDYIGHGKNGYLVAPGNVMELRKRLQQILSDLAHCKAMGQDRQQEQRRFFKPEHTAQKFINLYQSFQASLDS